MQIAGQFQFDGVDSDALWNFLTDTNRIAECLPGCEQLTKTGEGSYDMQMSIGIGSIRGVFSGQIRLHDLNPVTEYQMTVAGSGAPERRGREGTHPPRGGEHRAARHAQQRAGPRPGRGHGNGE